MVMINDILLMLRDRIETVLQNAQARPERWTELTNIIDQDGTLSADVRDKVVLSVVSLQSDTSTGAFVPPSIGQTDRYPVAAPPIFIDVYFLVMANFSGGNYPAGLGMISRVISFFQETPVITPQSDPRLPEEMDKLAIEFVNLDFAAANHVLTMSGVKAFPFVLYKLRRLPFAGSAISAVVPAVRSIDPRGGGAGSR